MNDSSTKELILYMWEENEFARKHEREIIDKSTNMPSFIIEYGSLSPAAPVFDSSKLSAVQ